MPLEISPREVLIYLSIKHKGDWKKIYMDIRERVFPNVEEAKALIGKLRHKCVTLLDPEYPKSISNSPKPPFVLYYEGNFSLISDSSKCVSIIGSREATEYGLSATTAIADKLASSGFSVVSGLAKGIDTAALASALDYGRAVAILGNGIDYYYPIENHPLQRKIARKGLLLSEYPGDTSPMMNTFPTRNRIIAAASNSLIVGEAMPHSGSSITISFALSLGRDVGVVPEPFNNGMLNNTLIAEGAAIIDTPDDAVEFAQGTHFERGDEEGAEG